MTRRVVVEQIVTVDVDESKFTEEFMQSFRDDFYPFVSIDEHLELLGSMFARGLVSETSTFIEGYGDPREMGIKFAGDRCWTRLVSD